MIVEQQQIPVLRFPEFNEEWEQKKLGGISDVRDGTHDTPAYQKSGYKLITSKNLRANGKIDYSNAFYISTDDFVEIGKRCVVDVGDILFGMIGTIGNPVLVDRDDFAIKNVALIKENGELINTYLIHYLRSVHILRQFHQQNTGGIQRFIALHAIRGLSVRKPYLEEQQKIAAFLSSVDTKIEQLNKKKTLWEQYKKGMMQKLFSQQIRFKDEQGNDYPDWESKKLEQVASIYRGMGLSKAVLQTGGEFPCILYGELFTKYAETIKTVLSFTNDKTSITSQYGDILMPTSDVTPSGLATASTLLVEDVQLGGDINIVRLNKGINPIFMSYLINFCKKEFIRLVTGTTVKHIYAKDIQHINFSIPASQKEQKKIARFLSAIDRKIELVDTELNQARTFKKGLLQQMFI